MRRVSTLCVVAWLVGSASSVQALIDMTGTWTFSGSAIFGTADYSILQVGTLVTLCTVGGTLHGTIDPTTGALTWMFQQPIPTSGGYVCNLQWTGTISPDGGSLTADEVYGVACYPPPFICNGQCENITDHPVTAVRSSTATISCCGNGVVDPGEACDPGLPNGCCASDCSTAASAGTACADDGNACTDDVCDGAGACTHAANTVPCGSTCQSGTCANGTCQLEPPAPAGTACHADDAACTVDACDGAGQCLAMDPCGPCGTCAPTGGCDPLSLDTCFPMQHGQLDVGRGTTPGRDHVRLTLDSPTGPASLGDPTTATSYTLCVFDSPAGGGTADLLFNATAPAASMCGSRPCWSTQAGAIRYADPSDGGDGIRKLRGAGTTGAATHFELKGRGAALGLPPTLNAGETLSAAVVAHDGSAFQACWGGPFAQPRVDTATHYHAGQ